MKFCRIENCGKEHLARGFCCGHWKKWRKYGDPNISKKISPLFYGSKCTVPECSNRHHAKGFCSKHFFRIKTWGDANHEAKRLDPQQKLENIRIAKRKYKKTPKGIDTEKRYQQSNLGKISRNRLTRRRRDQVRKATPPWVDRKEIKRIYNTARSGGMSVDHIHPLMGDNFSGLHVPWNLQIMTLSENIKKGKQIYEL